MDEASPLRSKLEATASRRLLLQVGASRDNPARRREAVWGRTRRRAAPNVSVKPCAGWRTIPGVAVTAAIAFSPSSRILRSGRRAFPPRRSRGAAMAAPFFRFIGPPFRPGDGAKECDAEIQPRSE